MNAFDSYSVFVGLDWADKKHDVCIQERGCSQRIFTQIEHSPEAIDKWVKTLHKNHKGNIAIAVELKKGPIIFALQKYPFIAIFPIHAATHAKYREAFQSSGAKNDPTDAEIALELLINYPQRFKKLEHKSSELRQLEILVQKRRHLVEEKLRLGNQLIATLKQYYPQPLEWFTHRSTELFCDFICRWPTLQRFKRAHDDTIREFFKSHGGHSSIKTESRIEQRKNAMCLTNDLSIIQPYQLLAKSLAGIIKAAIIAIREFDEQIEYLFNSVEDAKIFKSLPGTGPCLAPRLFAVFGEDRCRFDTPGQVQTFTGIAPVTVSSGQKTWIHWRWQCSKFERQSVIEKWPPIVGQSLN